jgi:hypothetical protein
MRRSILGNPMRHSTSTWTRGNPMEGPVSGKPHGTSPMESLGVPGATSCQGMKCIQPANGLRMITGIALLFCPSDREARESLSGIRFWWIRRLGAVGRTSDRAEPYSCVLAQKIRFNVRVFWAEIETLPAVQCSPLVDLVTIACAALAGQSRPRE